MLISIKDRESTDENSGRGYLKWHGEILRVRRKIELG